MLLTSLDRAAHVLHLLACPTSALLGHSLGQKHLGAANEP